METDLFGENLDMPPRKQIEGQVMIMRKKTWHSEYASIKGAIFTHKKKHSALDKPKKSIDLRSAKVVQGEDRSFIIFTQEK